MADNVLQLLIEDHTYLNLDKSIRYYETVYTLLVPR